MYSDDAYSFGVGNFLQREDMAKITVDINTLVDDVKGSIHVVPITGGIKRHITDSKCWCRPKRIVNNKDTGISVYSHFINGSKRK